MVLTNIFGHHIRTCMYLKHYYYCMCVYVCVYTLLILHSFILLLWRWKGCKHRLYLCLQPFHRHRYKHIFIHYSITVVAAAMKASQSKRFSILRRKSGLNSRSSSFTSTASIPVFLVWREYVVCGESTCAREILK